MSDFLSNCRNHSTQIVRLGHAKRAITSMLTFGKVGDFQKSELGIFAPFSVVKYTFWQTDLTFMVQPFVYILWIAHWSFASGSYVVLGGVTGTQPRWTIQEINRWSDH